MHCSLRRLALSGGHSRYGSGRCCDNLEGGGGRSRILSRGLRGEALGREMVGRGVALEGLVSNSLGGAEHLLLR